MKPESFTESSRPATEQACYELDRRRLLCAFGLSAVGFPWIHWLPGAAASAAQQTAPSNRFPRLVHEYFVRQVRRAHRQHVAGYERLQSEADARHYVDAVKAKIRECFGPEPERDDLNPRITGVVERDTYVIENVIFDSRPGFPVTANLYLPKERSEPRPGVVGSCGHSRNGKAEAAYQSFAQGLARLGYVCLIFDPIGQGERLQYVNDDLSPRIGPGVAEHLHAGNQQFLVGEFLGMWRAWDGIRALDYLLTREEVDPDRVGITGNSGGGTMTTWLCGVESRWSMAAPSCFVTSFRRNMENELPADTEQCPPKALALGLDHADFLAAMAPKPVIILAKERDYFDVRGSQAALRRLKRLYALLGAESNVELFIGPTGHGFSQENREAMYGFFGQAIGASHDPAEPPLQIEEDQTLWCTPQGQVAALEGTRTVFSFTRDKSYELARQRNPLSTPELKQAVRNVLKLPPDDSPQADSIAKPPEYRILSSVRTPEYPAPWACTYAVETEPGILAVVYMLTSEAWYSRPPRGDTRAILYVAHRSSDAELKSEEVIRDVIAQEPGTRIFTCDVRGIGESKPNTCGTNSFDNPYGCDYFYAIHSLMLDRPYLGQKTFDVLRVIQFLAAHGYGDIHLVAKGWGALAGAFASLLAEPVTQVTLKNALSSYAEVAESEDYHWPLATLLPNVLARFDLPDCYAALEDKQLRQIEPWGALGEKTP